MSVTLKIALPKGKLLEPAFALMKKAGYDFNGAGETRELSVRDRSGTCEALIIRAQDVPAYVSHGAADLGIAGQDVLWETDDSGETLFELFDLGFGRCRLVVASPDGRAPESMLWRVATKYARSAERFFQGRGRPVEIVKLYGSVELAPRAGIADVIVDLVETGGTLKANGLAVLEEIAVSTAHLVANRTAYRRNDAAIRAFLDRAGL